MIVVIKAPEKATLVLPDTKHPREIYLKSDNGEINVFLCPDANAAGGGGGLGSNENTVPNSPVKDTLLEDIDSFVTPIYEKYLSPRLKAATAHSFTHPVGSAQRNLSKALAEQQLPSSTATAAATTTVSAGAASAVFTTNELDLLGHSSQQRSSPSASSTGSADDFLTGGGRERTLNISPLSPFAKKAANLFGATGAAAAAGGSNSGANGAAAGGGGTSQQGNAPGKNVLMSEAGNFSPLHIAQFDANDDFSRFLSIEPPLETEYNFSLGNSEGVFDLFDFEF